jgi:uncharacterized membrane protein YkoI
MMKKTIQYFSILSLLSLGMVSTATFADDDLQEMEAISKGLGLITLEEAKAKALEAKPGVIKDAELENRKFEKGWDYEFEIVDADGKEWDVYVDAKSGKVNGVNRDWF